MSGILGIHWAGADRIIYLPLFIVLGVFIIRNYLRIRQASKLLVHPAQVKQVFPFFSVTKQLIKTILMVSALTALFIALLQPQWGKKEQNIQQEGRDLLIVLDVSRSMMAQDFKPSRLAFAKLKVRNLLTKLHFDRVGLILFSGTAFVQCPLTVDHAAFLMFLDHVDAEIISSGTTAIDGALLKALEVYGKSEGRKNKAVLLITDGEDFSRNLENVKRKAVEEHIKLFALGVGSTDGAPIPVLDPSGKQIGHEKDMTGQIVLSKLNESLLKEICKTINGTYVKARYDDSDIDQLAKIIKRFEKEKFMDKKISRYEDQYPWLLGFAWLFLMLEWLI